MKDDAPEADEETRAKRSSGSGSGARLRIVLRCTFCKDALVQREAVYCALCLAPHHPDCQRTHGRCAAPGCVCPATIRPRSTAERRRDVRPRLPASPRAALVNLPVLLAIVATAAGVAGSATVAALTVRRAAAQVMIAPPAPRPEPEPDASGRTWIAAVRLEANGFVQTVDLGAREQLRVGLVGDATQAWVVRKSGRLEVVLAVLPRAPLRVGLVNEGRELDQRVEAGEAATFELLWGWSWPEGYRPDVPRPGEPSACLYRSEPAR